MKVMIAAPRGFCAGVDRAIRIVELTIQKYGAPVEELDEVPDGRPVVFSAHGVPKVVTGDAEFRGLDYVDATCPLVSKVHRQAERLIKDGRHILFIGHRGHPEVIGTLGQVPAGTITLIETVADIDALAPSDPDALAFLTQTTLSVDDTAEMIAALQRRFAGIAAPRGEDICYATSNRQTAVKQLSGVCDAIIVLGAPNSSNSVRLVEVAVREGARAILIERASDLDLAWLDGVDTLGITAGASAPELLVRELINRLHTAFEVDERELDGIVETMTFKLPRSLEAA
jgi:4-hydroxy-3-methylbut-2-enyl diphosphate reductase